MGEPAVVDPPLFEAIDALTFCLVGRLSVGRGHRLKRVDRVIFVVAAFIVVVVLVFVVLKQLVASGMAVFSALDDVGVLGSLHHFLGIGGVLGLLLLLLSVIHLWVVHGWVVLAVVLVDVVGVGHPVAEHLGVEVWP